MHRDQFENLLRYRNRYSIVKLIRNSLFCDADCDDCDPLPLPYRQVVAGICQPLSMVLPVRLRSLRRISNTSLKLNPTTALSTQQLLGRREVFNISMCEHPSAFCHQNRVWVTFEERWRLLGTIFSSNTVYMWRGKVSWIALLAKTGLASQVKQEEWASVVWL